MADFPDWDSYFWPGSTVLRNRFYEYDQGNLNRLEALAVRARIFNADTSLLAASLTKVIDRRMTGRPRTQAGILPAYEPHYLTKTPPPFPGPRV
jgi:hypothetical protein